MVARTAADFVTQPGDVTVDGLTAEMAGWLSKQPEFRSLRISARGSHPAAYAYLTAVTVVGQNFVFGLNRTREANSPEHASESRSWVTSSEAATCLGIKPDAVLRAINRRRLPAKKVDGRWQIERADVEHYRSSRAS